MSSDWRLQALCRGTVTEMYYPTGHSHHANQVLALCRTCPVIEPCREHGVTHELYGVWGGTTGHQRKQERRRRGITLATPGQTPATHHPERTDMPNPPATPVTL